MTEDQLEQEALGWLASAGYTPLNARDLDNLDPRLLRASNREVVLSVSLRAAIDRLNPAVPAAARWSWGSLRCCRPTVRFTACWSRVCRCSTKKTARRGATLSA